MKENEIKNYMEKLHISREEAEQLWLDDNGYTENAEQAALDAAAKQVKLDTGVEKEKRPRKPREIKVSDEKQVLFAEIRDFLTENFDNVKVLKENKLIFVQIGEKIFDIDIREKRPPKV